MAKSDKKVHQWRMDGAAYALRIAKQYGIETLEKDLEERNAHFVPLEITPDIYREANADLALRLTQSIIVTMFVSLHEQFGFGKDRFKRLITDFNHQCEQLELRDPYGGHFVTVREMAEWLHEEYGCEFDMISIYKVGFSYFLSM